MSTDPKDRRQSPRLNATLEARLEFSVLLRDPNSSERGMQHLRACAGHTVNISAHGLAVVVPKTHKGIDDSTSWELRVRWRLS